MVDSVHPLARGFIEDGGNFSQAMGFGRAVGQIYAYLYFSPEPRTLDDMKEALGISKGSASMSVRQLEALGAVQHVWVKGDRRDFYVASDYFGAIIRRVMQERVGRRVESFGRLLDEAERQVDGNGGHRNGDEVPAAEFLRTRLKRLRAFQKKAAQIWNNPAVRMMLNP